MKRLFLWAILLLVGIFAVAKPVSANEGRISLQNSQVSCEGISVWDNSRYKITGRCQGLVYPYHDQVDGYFLWVMPDDQDSPIRIGDIDRGLFDGSTSKQFRSILVTAEISNSPKKPGDIQIISGGLSLFNFPQVNVVPESPKEDILVDNIEREENNASITPTPEPVFTTSPESTTSVLAKLQNMPRSYLLIAAGITVAFVFGLIYLVGRRA